MRWVPGLIIALVVSACVTPPTVATTPSNSGASPVETITKDDWGLLDGTELSPIQGHPARCDTSPPPVRAGVVPAVGSNPTQLRLKAREPSAVRWRLVGGYSGPILLRGHQLDGPAAVYFAPLESLATDRSSVADTDGSSVKTVATNRGTINLYAGMRLSAIRGADSWWTYVYAESPGCFFWQQNGRGYDGIMTFEVTP
jgi:hypothetical protein